MLVPAASFGKLVSLHLEVGGSNFVLPQHQTRAGACKQLAKPTGALLEQKRIARCDRSPPPHDTAPAATGNFANLPK
jgi:hypothetical protein